MDADDNDIIGTSIDVEYDDGSVETCEVIAIFDCEGASYVALASELDDGGVYLYGYDDIDDDTFSIHDIEDADEYDAAVTYFMDNFEMDVDDFEPDED